MIDHEEIFHLSYWRATQRTIDDAAFLDAFYKNFLASSPGVAREFKATDFDSLIRMLSTSIVHVAKSYRTRQQMRC